MAQNAKKTAYLKDARPVTVTVDGVDYALLPTLEKADAIEGAFNSPMEAAALVSKLNRATTARVLLSCSQDRVKPPEIKDLSTTLMALPLEDRAEVAADTCKYLMWMAHGFQGTADKPGNDNEGDENQESEEGNG
jgi:hypothetical protein